MADKRGLLPRPLCTLGRLFALHARMDLMWFLRDTRYCLLIMAADILCAAGTAAGMFLLSARFGGIGGMGPDEVLFQLGYATLVDGVYMLLFGGSNTGQISRVIGRGQLDHCLIQPVPLWIQILTDGFCPVSGSSMLVCGALLTGTALWRLRLSVTPLWGALLAVSVVCSTAVVLAVVTIVSCLAFLAPSAAEEIAGVAKSLFGSLKNFPLGGLPRAWQGLLTTLVPVGLSAWLPAAALLGAAPRLSTVWVFTASALLTAAAAQIFRKGMRYYAKYGSPRYSGFGHR